MSVDLCCLDIAVAQLLLDGANIRAILQKVCCERMPQGMRCNLFHNARFASRDANGLVYRIFIDVVSAYTLRLRIET